MTQTAFTSLTLNPALLENLESLEYHSMTPIQALALPSVLEGKDVIAQGKTGSGKTAVFALGILQNLDVQNLNIQALILCPTRELADQVAKEIRKLARTINNIKVVTLAGGVPFGPQAASLEFGAHIIVGTPGRIVDHLTKNTLKLDRLNMLVLDEADRMLDMGFQPALDAIMEQAPALRQNLLFSATFPPQIESISKRIMKKPVIAKVESTHDNSSIQQYLFKVEDNIDRLTAVRLLLLHYQPESAVVFCNTKQETRDVADELNRYGFRVQALHGDLDQRDRDQTLVRFVNKSISVLVATDVAARGLDIDSLDAVINYEIAHDPEVHIHRIGRTGRAGSKGIACTLYTEKDSYKRGRLEDYMGSILDTKALPPMNTLHNEVYKAPMITLQIDGGKKQKVRPGDILGALTADKVMAGSEVGKIQIFDNWSFVAVTVESVKTALNVLEKGKIKGRSFRVRRI